MGATAIKRVFPTMVGARKRRDDPLTIRHEQIAAMLADIVERLYAAIFLASHKDGFSSNILGKEIPRLRYVICSSQQQPGLGPDIVPFSLGEITRCVSVAAQRSSFVMLSHGNMRYVIVHHHSPTILGS
jgi:hypothetical protein